jgi:hypothetical protein
MNGSRQLGPAPISRMFNSINTDAVKRRCGFFAKRDHAFEVDGGMN